MVNRLNDLHEVRTVTQRDMLEKNGRLTTGNMPLNQRRKDLTNRMRDTVHQVRTMIANWPNEFELPDDHPIHEWLDVTDYICDETEK